MSSTRYSEDMEGYNDDDECTMAIEEIFAAYDQPTRQRLSPPRKRRSLELARSLLVSSLAF